MALTPHAQPPLPADETRELARLAVAMAAIATIFALAGVGMVMETGDVASAAGAVVMTALAVALIHARRQLLAGRSERAVLLLVAGDPGWYGNNAGQVQVTVTIAVN